MEGELSARHLIFSLGYIVSAPIILVFLPLDFKAVLIDQVFVALDLFFFVLVLHVMSCPGTPFYYDRVNHVQTIELFSCLG